MSTNNIIMGALKKFGYPVVPDLYMGSDQRYFTFNYADDRGANFGDNEPQCTISYIQVHFFLLLNENYLELKKSIRESLFEAGFTYPQVTILTERDNGLRHLVFECEMEEERIKNYG